MIVFENVFKEYPNGSLALQNINLNIPEGDFVFLVGSSGAGKSTMIKLLIRELQVTRGKILIDGNDITKLRNLKFQSLEEESLWFFKILDLFQTKLCTKM